MSYETLRVEAEARQRERRGAGTRIVVQDSHTTRAVGSQDVALALRSGGGAHSGAMVVVAGSDGASFLAPVVNLSLPSGDRIDLFHVDPETADDVANDPGGESPAPVDIGEYWQLQTRHVLTGCGELEAANIDDYLAHGGYAGLAAALDLSPEEVVQRALDADIRGRGGAYFPAGLKWRGARAAGEPRYVVVNAEEGEPGIFKDRHLMEGLPHRLIEGLLMAAYATGAARAFIYINAGADLSAERVGIALAQAQAAGLVGDDILGAGFCCDIEVRRGAGGYVCGEETTLLNTMEGHRRVPRLRPPFPTEAGLFGAPTVINNVETLCNVALMFSSEPAQLPKTKLVCLSGAVRRPGLIEIEMGTTLRQIVYGIGGGPADGRRVVGVVAGGPSGGLLPERMLDIPVQPGALHETGAVLGSGGVVVIDDSVPIVQVVRKLAQYNASESCGKCTPCREGTPRMVQALDRLIGGDGRPSDLDDLRYLTEIVSSASLCGLGQMAGGPITSGLHFFGDEFADLAGVR